VIADRAAADLRTITGLRRDPDFVRVYRYPRALPLVDVVHAARVRAIDRLMAQAPAASNAASPLGLHLLGQGLRGVGVNEGIRTAAALVRSL
jgi:oxygen-dependent protoporphyrinogen oxidase